MRRSATIWSITFSAIENSPGSCGYSVVATFLFRGLPVHSDTFLRLDASNLPFRFLTIATESIISKDYQTRLHRAAVPRRFLWNPGTHIRQRLLMPSKIYRPD